VLASDLAREVGGNLTGEDSDLVRVASLTDAGPGDLSFLSSKKYADQLAGTGAGAVLVEEGTQAPEGTTLIHVARPYAALRVAIGLLYPEPSRPEGIHPTAVIDPSAQLGEGASVGPMAVIGSGATIGADTEVGAGVLIGSEASIGASCRIHAGCVVYPQAEIGDRCELMANAVVGCDGFGHSQEDDRWIKIRHVGRCVLEDDVLVGACTTIARGTFGETRIMEGTKLDNLIMVAHNCVIGPHSAIAAQAGFAGSTLVGGGVQIGGQAGFAGHLSVGDRAVVAAQSGVTGDVEEGMYVVGFPARPSKEVWAQLAALSHLPELRRRVRELERRLAALETSEE
jgi:UDP-3-O-[3-hydroxymyristoyl] glucosamine N-acyltransferase